MMGVGVATGLSAGVCATLEAAMESGLITAEQGDQVLLGAIGKLAGVADGGTEALVGGTVNRAEVLEKVGDANA